MTKRKKTFNTKESESGIAVVLSLGLTALILGLVLTYITTFQVEKKAAINFSNIKIAKMLAESALRRTVIAMKSYNIDTDIDITTFSSRQTDYDEADSLQYFEGLSEKLPTTIKKINYYQYSSDNPESSDPVTWVYIKDDNKTDSPIIGRMAYVIISDKGKIDPSATVDSGGNYTSAISETNTTYTSTKTDGSCVVGRPGRDVNEMFLTSLDDWFTDPYAENMSANNAPGGKMPAGERWIDISTIFAELGISDDAIEDSFITTFNLYNSVDAEAFWIDLSNNSYKEPSEMYHRFNLANSYWDDFNVDSIVTNETVPFGNGDDYSDTTVTAIPWIKNWKDPDTDLQSDTLSQQIAANLIDYCDTDTEATTDDEDNPTYVGLDKSPYINEIKLKITGETQKVENTYTTYVKATPTIEIANMYENLENTKATISFDYKYDWTFQLRWDWWILINFYDEKTFTHSEEKSGEESFETTISITNTAGSYDSATGSEIDISPNGNNFSSFFGTYTKSENTFTFYPSYATPSNYKSYITNFKIINFKIKLTDNNDNIQDYSFIIESDHPASGIEVLDEDSSVNSVGNTYYNSQVNDPRQNLYSADWADSQFLIENDPSTIGSKYPSATCQYTTIGGTQDYETTSDPVDISTAYIRNAPMQSPWELGFIHRGANWQTINLKKYNDEDDSGMLTSSGGAAYTNGDANILDQIKMDTATEKYGKINLNTDVEGVLKVLFQKLYVGSDVGSDSGPGDSDGANEIDETDANTLTTAVLAANSTNGGSVFNTRAEIVRTTNGITELYNNTLTDQTNDAKQEEIIGKFINLTKASHPNIYTIIAVGESIKDIGGITVDKAGTLVVTGKGEFNIDGDDILASYKILVIVEHDPVTNKITILRFHIL
jgi:hypothetical protein